MSNSDSSKDSGTRSVAWRQARRVGAILGGALLLVVGAIMLITPGPGLLVMGGGLAVLASEVRWARTLLMALRERFRRWKGGGDSGHT